MTFRPSINGFSLSGLRTMPGMDGLVIKCNILLSGRKIGEFFDDGWGSGGSFAPCKGYKEELGLNQVLAQAFPPLEIEADSGWTAEKLPPVDMSISILVGKLVALEEDYKTFRKNGNMPFVVYRTDSRLAGGYIIRFRHPAPSLEELLRTVREHLGDVDIVSAYNTLSDFTRQEGSYIDIQDLEV